MVFAVEEINHSTNLLPGIKLGYHIRDNCGFPQWASQAALSLVGGDSTNCNTRALQSGYGQERGNKSSFPWTVFSMEFWPSFKNEQLK